MSTSLPRSPTATRQFRSIVLAGVALTGCAGTTASDPSDVGTTTDTTDAVVADTTAMDTSAADTLVLDVLLADTSISADVIPVDGSKDTLADTNTGDVRDAGDACPPDSEIPFPPCVLIR